MIDQFLTEYFKYVDAAMKLAREHGARDIHGLRITLEGVEVSASRIEGTTVVSSVYLVDWDDIERILDE